jgi:DHA1 family multidrug resistance protein-like MFS transporter
MPGKGLYLFFLSIFLLSTGFGVMIPAVPLYAALVFHANQWELGLLGALAALPYIFAPTIFGKFSDRLGRKPLIFVGLSVYLVTSLLYMTASSVLSLAALRLLEGLSFSLIWPAAEAYVGDNSSGRSRAEIVGKYSVAWSAGYMVGPFIYGGLVSIIGLRNSFIMPAMFMAASLAILVFTKGNSITKEEQQETLTSSKMVFPVVLYTMVIWGFASLSFFFLFPGYSHGYGISTPIIAYLVGIACMARTLVFLFYNKLTKSLMGKIVPLGMLLLSFAMIVAWGLTNIYGFMASVMLLGLSLGLIYAYSLVYVLNRPAKGLNAGLFESSIGIGEFIGPLSMGFLGFSISPSFPYLFLGVLAAASILLTLLAIRHA